MKLDEHAAEYLAGHICDQAGLSIRPFMASHEILALPAKHQAQLLAGMKLPRQQIRLMVDRRIGQGITVRHGGPQAAALRVAVDTMRAAGLVSMKRPDIPVDQIPAVVWSMRSIRPEVKPLGWERILTIVEPYLTLRESLSDMYLDLHLTQAFLVSNDNDELVMRPGADRVIKVLPDPAEALMMMVSLPGRITTAEELLSAARLIADGVPRSVALEMS